MARIRSVEHPIPGSQRRLQIVSVVGGRPGPVLAVIGSVHGDELEGPLAIAQLLSNLEAEDFAGALLLLPIANPDAVAAAQRCTPSDGKNLARVFPGDTNGSVTEALAALITEHVIAPADALIDLHSAAVASASPLFAGFTDTPGPLGARSREMALAFGAPVVWRHHAPCPPGRTVSVAEVRGIPAIYLEATGGVTPPDAVIDSYAEGILRVMQHLGMIDEDLPPAPEPLRLVGDGNTDSPTATARVSGLLDCHVAPLEPVAPDTLCFSIRDPAGKLLDEVRAGVSGYPVFLRRSRWVEAGDMLIAVAQPDT